MSDYAGTLPDPLSASIDEWTFKANELTGSRYGKVRVVLSCQALLKNLLDILQADRSRNSIDIALEIIQTENVALQSALLTASTIQAPREREDANLNPEDLDAVESFNIALFDLLWAPYDEAALDEAMNRLKQRLLYNDLGPAFLSGKRCVDLGCGGGRFSFTLSLLGAEQVFGIDLGTKSLDAARDWAGRLELENTKFEVKSCYDTGFESASIDFIVSNGVAHHHTRFDEALTEMHRILAPGGILWLYMTGPIDNILLHVSEVVKSVMRKIPVELASEVLRLCATPAPAFNTVMDGMYAVYYYRSTSNVTNALRSAGFSEVRPLKYVEGFDLAPDPNDKDRFGDGEIRLLVVK
ncbi:MAG: class I SAM-dependent methyltransferase [Gammaproteobacteria bacterium]|nr:class I SAM-dependent methyltransferase [Gammaproteobacteria bacterium]